MECVLYEVCEDFADGDRGNHRRTLRRQEEVMIYGYARYALSSYQSAQLEISLEISRIHIKMC